MNKGESPLLSGVLYVAIVGATMLIVINALMPSLNEKYEVSKLYSSFNCFSYLHNNILDMWRYAPGSEKEIRCGFSKGIIKVKDNMLQWSFEHPPSFHFENLGNAVEYSEINISDINGYYILENKVIRVNITKIGSKDSLQPINISTLINKIYNKVYKVSVEKDRIRLFMDNESCETGDGYVHITNNAIIISINPISCQPYDVLFKISDENQDFVEITAIVPSTNF